MNKSVFAMNSCIGALLMKVFHSQHEQAKPRVHWITPWYALAEPKTLFVKEHNRNHLSTTPAGSHRSFSG